MRWLTRCSLDVSLVRCLKLNIRNIFIQQTIDLTEAAENHNEQQTGLNR